jgi:two-component system nitrogen regulation sensor histidine kinase NtrY
MVIAKKTLKEYKGSRIYLLALAIICIVAAMVIRIVTVLNNPDNDRKEYLERLENAVHTELQSVYDAADQIENIFFEKDGRPTYTSLIKISSKPCFIFQNGMLVFWSDYRYVPDYESIAGNYVHKVLTNRNGQFISYQRSFLINGAFTEIFFLVPVVKKYQIDNNYIQSGLNPDIFPRLNIAISNMPVPGGNNISAANNDFLFSVEFPENFRLKHEVLNAASIILVGASILFLTLYILTFANWLISKRRFGIALLLVSGYLIGIRAVMLVFNIPYSLYNYNLFSPKYYASSYISPSLGDLLLNLIAVIIIISYVLLGFSRTNVNQWLKKSSPEKRYLAAVLAVIVSYFMLYTAFSILRTIYFNSQWTLDITSSIDFNAFKIVSLIIFILVTVSYFLASHILIRIFQMLTLPDQTIGVGLFVIGTLLYILFAYIPDILYKVVLPLNGIYFLLVYLLNFPKYLTRFKYHTYIYFFLSALVCAGIGTYSLHDFNEKETIMNKQRFAAQLLTDSDALGEYLLYEASERIRRDDFIKGRMLNLFSSKELIEQKIRRGHLPSYFDKYDVKVIIFNAFGEIITDIGEEIDYERLWRIYNKEKYRTEYPNIFFLNEPDRDVFKQYLSFIEIRDRGLDLGYIVLDLNLKRVIPDNVYPELLVDKRFLMPYHNRNYSYAIYTENELRYSFGSYNYEKYFSPILFQNERLFDDGMFKRGMHHLAAKDVRGKLIVISSPAYPVKNIITNFSFLFLILIIFIFLLVAGYALYYRLVRKNLTFATKIQIYLNIAFFLPLFTVSVIIMSEISRGYKRDLQRSFTKRSENVGANMVGTLERYKKGFISRETLGATLAQIAQHTETDINIFDRRGRLIVSTQPLIYEKELLSPLVNPVALAAIAEGKEKTVLLAESVGKLNYNSVYVGLRSNDSGVPLGILSIPFFESKYELDKQIIDVLSTIINIFTAIFIVFLVLSYFASKLLTEPLKLITQKIKRTTLGRNEPLEWYNNDEIGMMVGEYNKMLVNLEASKQALSRSEKESAWREMAQQVAHEIKNPLTPMKLTLQHLQRILFRDEELSEQSSRAINTLLSQVDNLNDIATSFSAFAKMPVPKNEVFEITVLTLDTVNLYESDADTKVSTHIQERPLFVLGDPQLMSRIITNLILNAIQSVPQGRKPEVEVWLYTNLSRTSVILEVKDNGSGIPDEIHDKVFIPNFSTKYAGSGIGLAVAKRGIEHAGGKIWFETQKDIGTTFFIELPLVKNM